MNKEGEASRIEELTHMLQLRQNDQVMGLLLEYLELRRVEFLGVLQVAELDEVKTLQGALRMISIVSRDIQNNTVD